MNTIQNKTSLKENPYIKSFLWGLLLSFLVFIPMIIKDQGMFFFYGDFNVQQIPFYMHAHDMVKNGNFAWSHLTDLGSGFIPSYSFYLLGSPFFWLTIPFPSEAVPYLMGPLLILKFACASLTAFIYLKRYLKNYNIALIGGILYAFSGFSIYNVFFNHFHESIIIFPLLLWALDEYAFNKRRGAVAIFVGISLIFNYYFFVGQAVFCVIYVVLRLLVGSFKLSIRDFCLLVFEVIIGILLGSVLLIPSVIQLLGNDRINNHIFGWDSVLYESEQRYIHILQAMFFPPDLPARPNFTPDSSAKWSSLGLWLPLFGMTGVIAFLQQRQKHWLKKLIYILFACAFIPSLNSVFQLFNSSYYARWFYMFSLMFVLATVLSLESVKVNWKRAITWNFSIVSIIAIIIGFMPNIIKEKNKETLVLGLYEYPTRFWSYIAISIISLAILIFVFRYIDKSIMIKGLCIGLSAISFIYSVYFIAIGKTQSSDPATHIIPYALNNDEVKNLDEINTARSDFYESLDNSGLYWKIPNIQAFHSTVSPSIMQFYEYVGVDRGVASRPETKNYALRALLSVKWLFDDDDDDEYFAGEDYKTPLMEGFRFYGNANGFDIWENEDYIPMGFAYDSYITESETRNISKSNRQLLMLKTAIIPDGDEEIWSKIVPKYDLENAKYLSTIYAEDCKERKLYSSIKFEYTKTGFESTFTSRNESPVFFSVPYDEGWRATVNGVETDILRTNIGFMSVIVPRGEDIKIAFKYRTFGLSQGLVLSVLGIVILYLYKKIAVHLRIKRKNIKKKRTLAKFSVDCKRKKISFTKNTLFERTD